MNAKEIVKHTIIEGNRAAYNYNLEILNALQEQGENALNAVLDRTTWIDGENRKAVDTWVETVKTGQANARAVFDQNFQAFERLVEAL